MENKIRKRWISVLISLCLIMAAVWMVFIKQGGRLCSYVPEHASWYMEMKNPELILNSFEMGVQNYSDSGLSILPAWKAQIAFTRELFSSRPDLLKEIENQDFGISAHSFSGSEAGYVFYLSCSSELKTGIRQVIVESLRRKVGIRLEEREYLGESILDISDQKGKTFSIAFLKTAVAGSFSGFLLEEIIRNSGVFLKPGFTVNLSNDPRYHHVEGNALKIFIQNENLPGFLRQYINAREPELIRYNSGALVLGFKGFKNHEIEFQGYAISGKKGEMLNTQSSILYQQFLPDESPALSFYLGKKDLWSDLHHGGKNQDETGKELIRKALADEMLVVLDEGQGLRKYDHLLVTKVKEPGVIQQILQRVAGAGLPSHIYQENYRGLKLFRHRNNKFSAAIAGPSFENWSASFYAEVGSYLLICDQIEKLRICVDRYLETKENPDNQSNSTRFKLEVAPGKLASALNENITASYRSTFSEWLPVIKYVRKIQIEDMGEPENPGFSCRIRLRPAAGNLDSLIQVRHIFLDSLVVSGLVRAGLPDDVENSVWLVQDLKKQVHFLNQNLELLHTIPQSNYWIQKPQAFRQNTDKAFSVLFSFPNRTEATDKSGQPTSSFSFNLPDSLSALTHSALIDYDRSLQHRLFAVTRHGYVLAADQSGKLLPGWNPRRMENPLAHAPGHIRVAGGDYMVFLDSRGNLILTNRKGQLQVGFPVKLKGNTYVAWFPEIGLDEENTFLYCLSDLGQMEKINLLGVQTSFIQLFRPEVGTRFSLHPDQDGRTFIIARHGSGSVTIFDQSYRPVLEHKSAGSRFGISHFQFGSSNKIYAITDLDQKLCYLYNEAGKRIIQKPFSCSASPDIFPSRISDGKFRMLSVFENRVSLAEFHKN